MRKRKFQNFSTLDVFSFIFPNILSTEKLFQWFIKVYVLSKSKLSSIDFYNLFESLRKSSTDFV